MAESTTAAAPEQGRRGRGRHTTVRLPAGEHEQLEQLAIANDRTVSAEIRRAVRAHLDRETPTP